MDEKWALFLILISNIIYGQPNKPFVREIDNIIFRQDPWWRGADGAATVAIGQDKVLWLFSDTFID